MRLVMQVMSQRLTEEQAAAMDAARTPEERAAVLTSARAESRAAEAGGASPDSPSEGSPAAPEGGR